MIREIIINNETYHILEVQMQNGSSYLHLQHQNGKTMKVNLSFLIQDLYEQKVYEDMNKGAFKDLEDMSQKIINYADYLKNDVMYQQLMRLAPNMSVDKDLMNQTLTRLLNEYNQKNTTESLNMNEIPDNKTIQGEEVKTTNQEPTVIKQEKVQTDHIDQVEEIQLTPEEKQFIESMSEIDLIHMEERLKNGNNAKHQALLHFIEQLRIKRKEEVLQKQPLQTNKVYVKKLDSNNLGYTNTFLLTFLTGIVSGMLLVVLQNL